MNSDDYDNASFATRAATRRRRGGWTRS